MALDFRLFSRLAYLLEAAGPLALERCGVILDRWVAETRGD
jgi:hypothetical protein